MLKLQIVGLISMVGAVAALALALDARRTNKLALRRHFDLVAPADSAQIADQVALGVPFENAVESGMYAVSANSRISACAPVTGLF
jgi:hypothetical protein